MSNFRILPTSGGLTVTKMLHFKPTFKTEHFFLFETYILEVISMRLITAIVFF